MTTDRDVDGLTGCVIQCVIRVHQILGPGFIEKVYRRALVIELCNHELSAQVEKIVLIHYDGHEVGRHRLDIVVEGRVIVELKTVETLSKAHYAQVRSYLKAAQLDVALLVNLAGPAQTSVGSTPQSVNTDTKKLVPVERSHDLKCR